MKNNNERYAHEPGAGVRGTNPMLFHDRARPWWETTSGGPPAHLLLPARTPFLCPPAHAPLARPTLYPRCALRLGDAPNQGSQRRNRSCANQNFLGEDPAHGSAACIGPGLGSCIGSGVCPPPLSYAAAFPSTHGTISSPLATKLRSSWMTGTFTVGGFLEDYSAHQCIVSGVRDHRVPLPGRVGPERLAICLS